MHRKKKLPVSHIICFAVAIVLAVFSLQLPVPDRFKQLLFFVVLIAVSFIGIVIVSLVKRGRRR